MSKISLHIFKLNESDMLWCIGSDSDINKLRSLNHDCNISKLVTFIVENGIYCYFSDNCELDVLSKDELHMLKNSGLMVSRDLVFEAMVLSNRNNAYDVLNVVNGSRSDIDKIFVDSWWLKKFDI